MPREAGDFKSPASTSFATRAVRRSRMLTRLERTSVALISSAGSFRFDASDLRGETIGS